MKHLKTLFLIFAVSFLISCSDDDDTECTECTSDSPYGTVGSKDCYETLTACNDAESGTCTRCD